MRWWWKNLNTKYSIWLDLDLNDKKNYTLAYNDCLYISRCHN
jgi:hypothetical protein